MNCTILYSADQYRTGWYSTVQSGIVQYYQFFQHNELRSLFGHFNIVKKNLNQRFCMLLFVERISGWFSILNRFQTKSPWEGSKTVSVCFYFTKEILCSSYFANKTCWDQNPCSKNTWIPFFLFSFFPFIPFLKCMP